MDVDSKVQEGAPEVPVPPAAVKAEAGGETTDEDGDETQLEKRQKKRQDTSAKSFAERLTKWELCREGLPARPSTLNRSSPQGSFPGQEAEAFAKECHQEGDSHAGTLHGPRAMDDPRAVLHEYADW